MTVLRVEKTQFLAALNRFGMVPKRTSLPVLSHVKLQAGKDKLMVSGTCRP